MNISKASTHFDPAQPVSCAPYCAANDGSVSAGHPPYGPSVTAAKTFGGGTLDRGPNHPLAPGGGEPVVDEESEAAGAECAAAAALLFPFPPGPKPSMYEAAQPAQMPQYAQIAAVALHHRCEQSSFYESLCAEASHQHEKREDGGEQDTPGKGGGPSPTTSAFHSSRVPGISVWDYIRRIGKYSDCTPECFIVAFIYLDRYVASTGIAITFTNIHRLVITAVLVSAKLRDDIYYSNAYYANIGGVSLRELNYLEIDFLHHLHWQTWIEPALFNMYAKEMEEEYQGCLPAK